MRRLLSISFILACSVISPLPAQDKKPAKKPDGNRLAYLDEVNLYYPHKDFAKLITPQWVGEEGVEAVVILAIDDMREPKRYETFLRPILNRLKKIDGRAPVSIMTCSINPKDPQLQAWLKEGLSLECHTFDHPCPFFTKGFAKAKETYDKCVDLLNEVPGSKPVAFRMPCCDSMNTPSPRFYAEIFNKVTDKKNFLSIDSSVFNVFTSADSELPRELVLDEKGGERFKRYLPADRSFVNIIENYPYPYVIGRLCWQFPCMTPSDWQAQHRHKPNNPVTVADWKAALDCTVIKKGVFSMVFHPHGWIKNEQVVEFIDHAVAKHGKKVKFLTFKEALERLSKTLFEKPSPEPGEEPWRHFRATTVIDLNNDGYLDLVTHESGHGRLWSPKEAKWVEVPKAPEIDLGTTWMLVQANGSPSFLYGPDPINEETGVNLETAGWTENKRLTMGLKDFIWKGCRYQIRTLDLDNDGRSELILSVRDHVLVDEQPPRDPAAPIFFWSPSKQLWQKLPFSMPAGLTNWGGKDIRFLDLDGDGKLDIIFSNEKEYGVYLFTDMEKGWSKKIMAGKRGDKDALPMISRHGTDNGFFVHSGYLWWSNEDTATMRDHVDRRKIADLLKKRE